MSKESELKEKHSKQIAEMYNKAEVQELVQKALYESNCMFGIRIHRYPDGTVNYLDSNDLTRWYKQNLTK